MRRREFVAGLLVVATVPRVQAQQPERMRRIGILMSYAEDDPIGQDRASTFQNNLLQSGWINGHNIQIEYRWYGGEAGRAHILAKEMVDLHPDLILVISTPCLRAVWQETRTIPIVFVNVGDPVGQGFVESLAKPGGNVTGFTSFDPMIGSKWLEVLREMSPGMTRVATLFNPETLPPSLFLRAVEMAAPSFSVDLFNLQVHDAADFSRIIGGFARESNGALLVLPDIFAVKHRKLIIELAAQHLLPTVYPFRLFADDGGLVSYGIDALYAYREAVTYVDRILRGAKPSELPVQNPTKLELVVNLKTAKALGLTVPGRAARPCQ